MNLWANLKKSKLSLSALLLLAGIFLTAIYAPLLANNKPLIIFTKNAFIYSDYLDSAQGTLQLIIDQIKNNQEVPQKNLAWLQETLYQTSAFLRNPQQKEKLNLSHVKTLILNKNIPLMNELLVFLKELQQAPLAARFFFPVFNNLSETDLFFMLLPPLFLVILLIRKYFPKIRQRHFIEPFLAVLLLSLIFSFLFYAFKDQQFDSYHYKKIAAQFTPGEWALFPIIPFGENENRMTESSQPPTLLLKTKKPGQEFHFLGTDTNGRDVLARMIYGARVSISVGFVAVSIYVLIGIILGSLAGFYGGWTDIFISRIIEIMICFPVFFLILTVMAFLKPSIFNIMVIIGLTGWTGIARLMRGEFLRLKNQEFVLAAQSMGASNFRLIFRHIFPNGVNPIVISATFGIAGAILTESALSFLGFGVPQPTASWGDILNNGRNDIYGTWWLTVFPGIAIFTTVTSFNLLGEKLRDLLDPKMKPR